MGAAREGPLKLWDEGVLAGPEVDPLGRLVKYELPLRGASALKQLQTDYAFFTPAILYLLGVVTDQPLLDFLWEYRQPVRFYFRKFRLPLFAGLEVDGDAGWNHGLWALEREHWPVFADFYCSLKISNRPLKRLFGVGAQLLTVVDPVALERRGFVTTLPTVTVAAFGVNGNTVRAAFEAGPDPLTSPPRLRYYDPDEEMRVYAAAHHRGDNPEVAAELYRRRNPRDEQAQAARYQRLERLSVDPEPRGP